MRNTARPLALRPATAAAAIPARLLKSPTLNSQPSTLNSGFTLIEMLVAISILVILTTLAVGAFNSNNNDRANSSANTLKTVLDGARMRAIKSKQIRGLRLLTDPNDPRIVTSLQYVGAPDFDEGTCALGFVGGIWVLQNETAGRWSALKTSNLLEVTARVEVPARSGNWYTVTAAPAGNDLISIAGHYNPSQHDGTTFVALPAAGVAYRLELSPAPLAEDPIPLSAQTCIDLDGSEVPAAWRPATTGLGVGVTESYSNRMDILFTPAGALTGGALSKGALHFRIAYINDVILEKTVSGRPLDFTATSAVVMADAEKDQRAVSIFTQTGAFLVSDIDRSSDTEDGIFHNDRAGDPFRFAAQGKDN